MTSGSRESQSLAERHGVIGRGFKFVGAYPDAVPALTSVLACMHHMYLQHALLGSGKVAFTVQPFPFRDFVARVPWLRQPLRTHRCAVCASHYRCKASGHAEGLKGSKVVGVAAAAAHTAGGTATALWFPRTARSFSLEAAAHAAFRHPNTVAEYAQ